MTSSIQCPHISGCALYPKFALKGSLKIWKSRFCEHGERHKSCQRFILSKEGKHVPATMLPNGEELAT